MLMQSHMHLHVCTNALLGVLDRCHRNVCACVNVVYVWEAGTHMSMHVDVQRRKRTCPETCISTWEEQRKGVGRETQTGGEPTAAQLKVRIQTAAASSESSRLARSIQLPMGPNVVPFLGFIFRIL